MAIENDKKVMTEVLKYVWDEYKYRHDLCWRTVYKVTFAVVTLNIIPYANPELTQALGWLMIFPLILSTILSLFGIFLLQNELDLFAKIKIAYQNIQNQLWHETITVKVDLNIAKHNIHHPESARFDYFVRGYAMALTWLSLVHTVVFAWKLVPIWG